MTAFPVPTSGEAITMSSSGHLQVPDQPILPFIEGDGTGPDIWRSSVRVLDAAVAKAYGGKKKITWHEVLAGEKAFNQTGNWLPDQTITDFKGSLKQVLGNGFSLTAGTSLERTGVSFDLYSLKKDTANHYWNWLPFANFNKTWESQWSVTLVYRRTIRRPGLGELNPSVDYSDPYNIRFGNPGLQASTAHNFDFYLGKNSNKFYLNYGVNFNKVQDIFSQIQTLQPDGVTQTTFQNISQRSEAGTSTWTGYTFSRAFRVNLGASYNYNIYSDYDHVTNNYHDGGSLYSNFNLTWTPTRLWNITGSCLFNRYANPQGASSSYVSMNMGVQRKFFDKRFIVTLNIADPFVQQHGVSHTYGTDFNLESYSSSQTRNFRLTLSYDLHHVIDAGRNKLLKAGRQSS